MEKEVLRPACLQTFAESNGALRKLLSWTLFVTHLVTAHLLQLILMQGSKLAGARNKSDLWPKYVACHTGRHGVAWVQERQRLFRMPSGPHLLPPGIVDSNLGAWQVKYAATRCLVVLDSNLGGGQNRCTHQRNMVLGNICGLPFWLQHDIHAEICTLHQESCV